MRPPFDTAPGAPDNAEHTGRRPAGIRQASGRLIPNWLLSNLPVPNFAVSEPARAEFAYA